jgi:hypothetical protein
MYKKKLKYASTIEHYINKSEHWLKLFIEQPHNSARRIFVAHYIDLTRFMIKLQKEELANDIGSE